jgi:Skp family chaperone for outer membrane proteins
MQTNLFPRLLVAAAIATSIAAFAADDPRETTQPSDPARWAQPIETPRQAFDNTMKEARNALADAVKECRASGAERKACEAEARRQYERDAASARKTFSAR